MPDNDVDIQIKIAKTGDGAQQAKSEIDALKKTAEGAGESTQNLHYKLVGFRTILSSVGMMARGGAEAVAGLGRALGGVVMVLSNTAWGKIAMIAATLVSIGVAVYQSFKPAKDALDKTSDAAGRLHDKLPKDLGEPGLPNAVEYAKKLTEEFDKATAASDRTRKSMDELSDAQLALQLANIDREVAAGGMTEDQGKQARIEARLSHEQDKIAREKAAIQDKISRGEKTIAETAESYAGAAGGIVQTETEIKQRGYAPGVAVTPADLTMAIIEGRRKQTLEANMLQKRLAEQKQVAADRLKGYDVTKEKITPELETGEARLSTLDVLSQASTVGASAQSMAVSSAMFKGKDEIEAKRNADRAAEAQARQAEQEKRRDALARSAQHAARDQAESRAALALDQQQAEEQAARIHLQAAERQAGAKGQTPSQRRMSATALQSARSDFARESSEVTQASAIQGQIRNAVDPADVAKLLQALESIGRSFKEVANAASTQASQMKNGGLRTK